MASSAERVVIGDEALEVAIEFARTKKAENIDAALEGGDPAHYELVADWRDCERTLMRAMGGVGLYPVVLCNPFAE